MHVYTITINYCRSGSFLLICLDTSDPMKENVTINDSSTIDNNFDFFSIHVHLCDLIHVMHIIFICFSIDHKVDEDKTKFIHLFRLTNIVIYRHIAMVPNQ